MHTFLTLTQVADRLACSKGTVRRWSKVRKDFPKPHRMGPKVYRWLAADIEAFLARIAPEPMEAA